jgi:hypothetical protein
MATTISNLTCSASGLCTWNNPGKPINPLLLNIDGVTVVLPATTTNYQIPAAQLKVKETVTLQRVTISVQNSFTTTVPSLSPPVNISPPIISDE